jgi:hypothetical protein
MEVQQMESGEQQIKAALATRDATAFHASFVKEKFWAGPWASAVDAMSHDVRMFRLTKVVLFTRRDPRSMADDDWFAAYGVDFEQWLQGIGAVDTARYVRELLNLFPDGVPIEDRLDRGQHLTATEKEAPEIWRQLRARYPTLEGELAERLRVVLEERGPVIAAECDALRVKYAERCRQRCKRSWTPPRRTWSLGQHWSTGSTRRRGPRSWASTVSPSLAGCSGC